MKKEPKRKDEVVYIKHFLPLVVWLINFGLAISSKTLLNTAAKPLFSYSSKSKKDCSRK